MQKDLLIPLFRLEKVICQLKDDVSLVEGYLKEQHSKLTKCDNEKQNKPSGHWTMALCSQNSALKTQNKKLREGFMWLVRPQACGLFYPSLRQP